jgi:hypothetical protein
VIHVEYLHCMLMVTYINIFGFLDLDIILSTFNLPVVAMVVMKICAFSSWYQCFFYLENNGEWDWLGLKIFEIWVINYHSTQHHTLEGGNLIVSLLRTSQISHHYCVLVSKYIEFLCVKKQSYIWILLHTVTYVCHGNGAWIQVTVGRIN